MKRITYTYYLFIIVFLGLAVVAWWVWARYIKQEQPELLKFKVERGSIEEVVRVRGEVVPQKDFDLGFNFSGIVDQVLVKEGEEVQEGTALMRLDATEFKLEEARARARLEQYQADLEKLLAGATAEDIIVAETKVSNAEAALLEYEKAVRDAINDGFTKSDDAVRNKTDQIFDDPQSVDPKLILSLNYQKMRDLGVTVEDVEQGRFNIGGQLNVWQDSLQNLSETSDLSVYAAEARDNLNKIKDFLNDAAAAVNSAVATVNIPQTSIDSWKSDIATARTNIDTAIMNLTTAEKNMTSAKSDLDLARRQLEQVKAPARPEDIAAARAKIKQAESDIAAAQDRIKKSILSAPASGKIAKVWLEPGEMFQPGQIALSFNAEGWKVQADVSELDIRKIRDKNGNAVKIALDAFPGVELEGRVISIEPKEIVKEGDIYYRVNVSADFGELELRSGMSADLFILVSRKENILKIPGLAVSEKDDKKFVTVLENGRQKEVEIATGISDGEYIEVLSGLREGQEVVVKAE